MAKLILLFLAVFCAVHISSASRLPRDIAGTEDSQASPTGKLEDELHKLRAGIEKVFKESLFNKENVEKAASALKTEADGLSEKAQGFAKSLQSQVEEYARKAQAQAPGNMNATNNN